MRLWCHLGIHTRWAKTPVTKWGYTSIYRGEITPVTPIIWPFIGVIIHGWWWKIDWECFVIGCLPWISTVARFLHQKYSITHWWFKIRMSKTRPVNTMLQITANLHSHPISYTKKPNYLNVISPVKNKRRKKTIAYQLELQFPLPTPKQLRLSKKNAM